MRLIRTPVRGGGRSRLLAAIAGALLALCVAPALASATPAAVSWGSGKDGELGNNATKDRSKPAGVSGLAEISALDAGANFGIALHSGGTVYTWGADNEGQLGPVGSNTNIPQQVFSLSGVSGVAAGDQTALALKSGAVYTWGQQPCETEGVAEHFSEPKAVSGISTATAVSAGSAASGLTSKADNGDHELALLENGTVMAWGNNEHGQLGDGTTENSCSPVKVKGLEHVVAISAGGGSNFALLENGTLMAWGADGEGELGTGVRTTTVTEAKAVSGLTEVTAVSGGGDTSLAVTAAGKLYAWGTNQNGELGQGTAGSEPSDVPLQVPGITTAIGVAAGEKDAVSLPHDLVLLSGGTVKDWGNIPDGENVYSPTSVAGIKGATELAAGWEDSLAGGVEVPVVTRSSPVSGLPGTVVTVEGFNLGEASSVEFGGIADTAITEDTATKIKVTSPSGSPKQAPVAVVSANGESGPVPTAQFRIEPPGGLIWGRCQNVGAKKGRYKNAKCTETQSEGKDEWTTEIAKKGFSLSDKEVELATEEGALVNCTSGSGAGEFTGEKAIRTSMAFTGCSVGKLSKKQTCTSPGAAEGELRTASLEGVVGFENRELNNAAVELFPAAEEAFVTFTCGTTTTEIRGAVFGTISPVNAMNTVYKIKFNATKGRQHLNEFEGGSTPEVLEASVNGGAFEAVGLNDTTTLTSEEEVELNSVL
jgi:alpha-tubulin suppressor-like RCC1 family protein